MIWATLLQSQAYTGIHTRYCLFPIRLEQSGIRPRRLEDMESEDYRLWRFDKRRHGKVLHFDNRLLKRAQARSQEGKAKLR